MEYVYATLLLHKCGSEINEENIKKILNAAGVKVDDAKVKALVSALKDVNIEEAIKEAAFVPSVAPAEKKEEKKEEKPKEEEKDNEAAAAGLGALFG